MSLVSFSVYSQIKDYYSIYNSRDTLIVDDNKYIVYSFQNPPYRSIALTNINNSILYYSDYNIRRKDPNCVQYPRPIDLYVKHDLCERILKKVFDDDDCQKLAGYWIRINIYVDQTGKVREVNFYFVYSKSDHAILSIPPEKFVAIERILKEELQIIFNEDEDPSAERKNKRKEFLSRYDFDYLPTEFVIRFNGNLEILNHCDIIDEKAKEVEIMAKDTSSALFKSLQQMPTKRIKLN